MSQRERIQGKKGNYFLSDKPFAFGRTSLLYEALDERGDTVCVKIFRSSPMDSRGQSAMADFARELTAQRKLNHPHILPIIDFDETRPFLVLPLCKGGNLRLLMRQKQFLPLNETVLILQQIALGVDFAHDSGFIHGDIKPENILFSEDYTHAFLCDFSMAKYFAITERVSTAAEMVGGSSAYLSPEQIADGKQSPRSDIYALATVTYEMLTGVLPFDVDVPPFKQMQAKINGELHDPGEVNPTLPLVTRKGLMKGLSVQGRDRPESAVGFCSGLSRADRDQNEAVQMEVGDSKNLKGDEETKSSTRVDRILRWLNNNPLVSSLIVIGIALGGIATAATHIKELTGLFKREHTAVIATVISNETIMPFDKSMKDVTVRFGLTNPKQKLQRVTLTFPSDLAQESVTVAPPFTKGLRHYLFEMNTVLAPRIPLNPLPPGKHAWACKGSFPVVLTVDYLTSADELRTESALYLVDFYYRAYTEEQNFTVTQWSVDYANFRYERPLGWYEQVKPAVESEMKEQEFTLTTAY